MIRRRADDSADPTHLRIDDLEVDLQARKVTRGGLRLDLTAKEFCLLSLLARHQGEILSKLMIAEQVWDMNFDSDANVVEVAIKRVRAKVDAPYPRKLLHTVRGMGYVLRVVRPATGKSARSDERIDSQAACPDVCPRGHAHHRRERDAVALFLEAIA